MFEWNVKCIITKSVCASYFTKYYIIIIVLFLVTILFGDSAAKLIKSNKLNHR